MPNHNQEKRVIMKKLLAYFGKRLLPFIRIYKVMVNGDKDIYLIRQ
ncbi:hypothetical protein BH09BAC4_BH09BAC4_17470 [soil metagenome]